jgi:hypothetical protein
VKKILSVMVVVAVLAAFAPATPAQAQSSSLDDLFTRVSPTVVVVRSKGRDVSAGGVTRFTGAGSGVLVSSDGKVMTAAHVVNGMDEITVEGIGGEVVSASVISANAAADVPVLQIERVTKAMRVAREGLGFIVGIKNAQSLLVPRKVFWGCPSGRPAHRAPRDGLQRPGAGRFPHQDGGPGLRCVEHGPAGE